MERWILRVLQLSSVNEMPDLMWTVSPEGEVKFFIMCSDAFWWGTADAEPLTAQTLHLLEAALADADRVGDIGAGPLLYCARRRAMRPQGAMYKHLSPATWPLFDACGPDRLPDVGNPVPHPPAERPPALR